MEPNKDQWNLSRIPLLICISTTSTLSCLNKDLKLRYDTWTSMIPMWLWFAYDMISTLQECKTFIIRESIVVPNSRSNYWAKSILAFGHLLALCFCILMCVKIEQDNLMYTHAFIPLFLFCIVHFVSFYAFRNVRQPQIDDLVAVNIITFLLISLRLDGNILISWTVVFIPLWIIIILLFVILLYGCILVIDSLFTKNADPSVTLLRQSTVGYTISLLCFLIFMILLTQALENHMVIPMSYVNLPLLACLITIIMVDFLVPSPESYFSLANCNAKAIVTENTEASNSQTPGAVV
ncbi:hypothetical protein FGIG_04126 [Fasciola gigantica]|uniref:Uncharacterized protein n=1 Tax=Fasciola gigantica TaxID=46835 RepID=A0A504YUB0_FASGI|nr:hypothetical protein FGIG_04126 [Fasciola gigantica]